MDIGEQFLKDISKPLTPTTASVNPEDLKGQLTATRSEIEALEVKLLQANNPGSPYMVGNQFDAAAYKRDELTLSQLNRRYSDATRQLDAVTQSSRAWEEVAKQAAANFLRGNMSKIPDGLKESVRASFATDFNQVTSNGMWLIPQNQSHQVIQGTVERLFDSAYGRAFRAQPSPQAGQRPTTESDVATMGDLQEEENPLLKAWLERKKSPSTLYEEQRKEREARLAGK